MSLARQIAVVIEDWSQSELDTHDFEGNLVLCRRSQGVEPMWILFISDGGDLVVHDYFGDDHPEDSLETGFNPDDAYINNADPPMIAVQDGTTIRVYREGAELFNTGAIANLQYINISNGYLHCTVGNDVGIQWRSLVNGNVLHTVAIGMTLDDIGQIYPIEDGSAVFTQYRDDTGSQWGQLIKAIPTGVSWNVQSPLTGGIPRAVRAAADGSIIIGHEYGSSDSCVVVNATGGVINRYAPIVSINFALATQPNGVCAAWARWGSTTARIVQRDGTITNIVLPANIVSRRHAVEIVRGEEDTEGYVLFECVNGNIYIYNLAGALQATVDYGLGEFIATPLAAVTR